MIDIAHYTTAISTTRALRGRRMSLMGLFGLYQQRRTLAELTEDQLADIGVTASQAEAEATRKIWDVPAHWRA